MTELYPVQNDYPDEFKIPPANRIDHPGALTLYHAATGFEKALADTDAERLMDMYAEAIIDEWNPWQVAYEHLPFLASAQGVNLWEDWWSETQRRSWTARQWYLKSIRGKRAGLDEFVAAVGGHVKRCVVPPAIAYGTKAQTDAERAAYVARFPQLRIYPYVARELLPWLCYCGKHYDGIGLNRVWNKNGSFLGPIRRVYPTVQDAGGKYTRTAELYEPRTGVETLLTIRQIVNIDMGPGAGWGFTPGVSQYDESVILPLLHRPNYFCSEPRKYLGVNIYLGAELPLRTISIGRSGPMELTQAKAQYQTTFPQAELLDIRPEYVSIQHPRRKTELYAARGEYLIRAKSIVTHAVASDLVTDPPSYGRTSFVELVVFKVLFAPAPNFAVHAPTLGTPLLQRFIALVATGKTVGAPTLGTPAATQTVVTVRNFVATNIAVQSPIISVPTVGGVGVSVRVSPDNMTADNAPAPYVASASSEFTSQYQAFYAFNSSLNWFWGSGSGLPQFIQIDLGSPATAGRYTMQSRSDQTLHQATAWTLAGSNDGTTWTTADTQSGIAAVPPGAQIGNFTMATPGSWRYWRWTITASLTGAATDSGNLALYSDIGFDTDTTAWIAAVGAGNVSSTRRGYVNTLITGLKADGVWAKLDRLWLFAAENATSALVDLKARTTATVGGSPAFTADSGYKGNGANTSINSNVANNFGGNYTQNSACLFGWNNTAGLDGGALVGTGTTQRVSIILPAYTDGNLYAEANYNFGGWEFIIPNAGATGLYVVNRSAVASATIDLNGSQIAIDTTVSSLPLTSDTFTALVGSGGTGWSNRQCSCMGFGGGLTAGDRTALYARLRTYMIAVGVP